MTILTWVAALVVTVAAVLLGRVLPWQVGIVLGSGVALVVVVMLRVQERRRIRRLAEHVNAWMGAEGFSPLELDHGGTWHELSVALNALGASHARRGRALRRERPLRREFVDQIVGPALLFSEEGRLLAANTGARRLLSVPDDEDVSLIQALGSVALASAAREARAVRRPVEVDTEVAGRELRATASVVGDETLVLITDLTERRRVEELRRDFIVNASHELKTPATAIRSLVDALDVSLSRTAAEGPRELLARLREEAERLVRLVHDLLDLRRLDERGQFETEAVDVAALVREVVADQHPMIEDRGLRVEVDATERAVVAGLPDDLRLVVHNLVTNAVLYNREGGSIRISVGPSGDGDVELVVSDTGIGIATQDLDRIFERFYRVDVARSRERGGTGLGLSIVRNAVTRHGGRVGVDSLLGEGTTVTVRLPISGAEGARASG